MLSVSSFASCLSFLSFGFSACEQRNAELAGGSRPIQRSCGMLLCRQSRLQKQLIISRCERQCVMRALRNAAHLNDVALLADVGLGGGEIRLHLGQTRGLQT